MARSRFNWVSMESCQTNPELWVLGIEQQGQDGTCRSVDAVCAEHPAFDWITFEPGDTLRITFKPGDTLNSWALAVEFPEPTTDLVFAAAK